MRPICERCKTTTHKDHKLMELTEYKDRCIEDLKAFKISLKTELKITENALQRLETEIMKGDESENESNAIIQRDEPTDKKKNQNFQELELRDRLIKQKKMIRATQEKIEETASEFVLDPLDSVKMTKETYEALKAVLEEEHQLMKVLSESPATKDFISTSAVFPKVTVNAGMDHSIAAEHFVVCKGGDVVIAGVDNLQKQWRLRRFSRLGQLEWDKPLPMSWTECHGIAYFRQNQETILLSNADRKKIVLINGDGSRSDAVVCYSDDEKAPAALCVSFDLKRLFYKDHTFDHDEGKVEVLDTSTMPFTPLQTITLGFSYTHGLTYLGGDRNLFVFTSYEKKSIRAISGDDGREVWTVGPQILGKNCQPHHLCATGNGKPFEFLLVWYKFILHLYFRPVSTSQKKSMPQTDMFAIPFPKHWPNGLNTFSCFTVGKFSPERC